MYLQLPESEILKFHLEHGRNTFLNLPSKAKEESKSMKLNTPIFASEVTAARLLDLGTKQFMDLVAEGHLPRGNEIAPGVTRWDTDLLKRISNGEGGDAWGAIEW